MQKNHKLIDDDIPEKLRVIPSPPKQLFYIGQLDDLLDKPMLAVVGSRKISAYGQAVTDKLVREVAAKGVVIVSGLALGADACALKAALDGGGRPLAILPTGLDNIVPKTNLWLSRQIVDKGGVLMSEHETSAAVHRSNFVIRNRLVSGISDAVLVIEATENGGTMHTVNFAKKQKKPLLAVPGSINSPLSQGPNSLLKAGATPVTEAQDILNVFGINKSEAKQLELIVATDEEKLVIELIQSGLTDGHELQKQSKLTPGSFNQTLTMLELSGHIKSLGNNQWSIS